jgi:hypothetical protein
MVHVFPHWNFDDSFNLPIWVFSNADEVCHGRKQKYKRAKREREKCEKDEENERRKKSKKKRTRK